MSDIVERLRSMSGRDFWPPEADRLCAEAADEIERLRSQVAELQDGTRRLHQRYGAEIERLRAEIEQLKRGLNTVLTESNAEIERLRARNAELRRLLLDCRGYVSDAGNDEDPETQRLSADLCAAIDAALAKAEGRE